jgi:hypothetical protein
MAFKPANSNTNAAPMNSAIPRINWSELNKGVKAGSRPARVSLVVDLGIQERDPSTQDYNPSNTKHADAIAKGAWVDNVGGKDVLYTPRKPVQQVAVLADLMNDVVDYGGVLGKQPYRIVLNPTFKGEIKGVDLVGCYSFDDQGKRLEDKPFTFHAQSLLTKLAKATKQLQIIDGGADNMDVSLLANQPFMAQITVNTSGENIYVNYKGCAEVPMIEDDEGNEAPLKVKPLTTEARVITFDSVTEDDLKFLRGDLVKKIRQASNYAGSKMQAVLEASSNTSGSSTSDDEDVGEPTVAAKTKAPAKPPKAPVEVSVEDDLDDPFA